MIYPFSNIVFLPIEGFDALVSANNGIAGLKFPAPDELYSFLMMSAEEEHRMWGDWDSNRDDIVAETEQFVGEILSGEVQALTDGRGLIVYGIDNGKMNIYDVYVLPQYRGNGVGGQLLDSVIRIAGNNLISLTVNGQNTPAIHLYENKGFVKTGEISDNGILLIRMERMND